MSAFTLDDDEVEELAVPPPAPNAHVTQLLGSEDTSSVAPLLATPEETPVQHVQDIHVALQEQASLHAVDSVGLVDLTQNGAPNEVQQVGATSDQPNAEPQPAFRTHSSTAIRKPILKVEGSLPIQNLSQVIGAILGNQTEISQTQEKLQALLWRQAALFTTERLLQQQKVIDVLGPELGYSFGRPVAALLIYRCCLQWKLFVGQAAVSGEPSGVLDAFAEVLARYVDEDELAAAHGNDGDGGRGAMLEMAHWLCVISTLLAMVDHHVPRVQVVHKTTVAQAAAQKLNEAAKKMSNTLNAFKASMMQKMARVSDTAAAAAAGAPSTSPPGQQQQQAGPQQQQPAHHPGADEAAAPAAANTGDEESAAAAGPTGGSGNGAAVEPHPSAGAGAGAGGPSPPQAFRQALEVLLLKAYGACRDNIKRHLSMLLPACIQAPTPPPHVQAKHDQNFSLLGEEEEEGTDPALGRMPRVSGDERAAYLKPWSDLCGALGQHLALLREAYMPRILIKCLVKQAVAFINSQLFNQLLLRPEVCCTSNTAYVGAGLALLDAWLRGGNGLEDLRVLAEDLRHVKQACRFLTYRNKTSLRLDDITAMCPALNLQQIYRLCTTSWDDSHTQPSGPASPTAAGAGGVTGADAGGPAPGGGRVSGSGAQVVDEALAANGVSGEVLEELKRRHHVSGNGGLIVTFLLEEDSSPVIAPGGVLAAELFKLVDDPALYAPLPVPAQLQTEDCPRDVFAYLETDLRPADLPRPAAALVGATTSTTTSSAPVLPAGTQQAVMAPPTASA